MPEELLPRALRDSEEWRPQDQPEAERERMAPDRGVHEEYRVDLAFVPAFTQEEAIPLPSVQQDDALEHYLQAHPEDLAVRNVMRLVPFRGYLSATMQQQLEHAEVELRREVNRAQKVEQQRHSRALRAQRRLQRD